MNSKTTVYLSFVCVCLILLSACGNLPAENTNMKLTDSGIYTFSAVDYIEQEGPRVLKPGGHGSVPGETFYYVVMESESGDYRFYEPTESLSDAMRAVNGNFGHIPGATRWSSSHPYLKYFTIKCPRIRQKLFFTFINNRCNYQYNPHQQPNYYFVYILAY